MRVWRLERGGEVAESTKLKSQRQSLLALKRGKPCHRFQSFWEEREA